MLQGEEARLLSLRILQNFVRETSGKWDPSRDSGPVFRRHVP